MREGVTEVHYTVNRGPTFVHKEFFKVFRPSWIKRGKHVNDALALGICEPSYVGLDVPLDGWGRIAASELQDNLYERLFEETGDENT